jgi:hypothetical protein
MDRWIDFSSFIGRISIELSRLAADRKKSPEGEGLNADRISAVFWLLVGGSALTGSISLGLGTTREPGSGFLSFLASSFVCLMALIIFLQSLKKSPGAVPSLQDRWRGAQWKRPLAVSLFTLGYILVFGILGFALATFLLMFVLLRALEHLPWKWALIISALSTGFCYGLLRISLEASLPKGILGI